MNYWFTSDTHFGHRRMIMAKPEGMGRPWASAEEMDEALTSLWNSRVQQKDTVYHLGDFCWAPKSVPKLNGKIFLCEGNHDRLNETLRARLSAVYGSKLIKLDGRLIWISHYSHRAWPHSHYGAWHLFGHSHGGLPRAGLSMDVGVDAVQAQWPHSKVEDSFRPWAFDEIVTQFKSLEVSLGE